MPKFLSSAVKTIPAWVLRPEALLALAAAAALLAGLAAGSVLPLPLRAALAAAAAAAGPAWVVALRWRDQRLMDEAARIAGRFAAGERGLQIPERAGSIAYSRLASVLNEAAESISRREAHFALLAKATGEAVWNWDISSDLVGCSHGGTAVLGLETDAFVHPLSWWQDRVHADQRGMFDAGTEQIRQGAVNDWSMEYRFRRADGGYNWVWDRGVVVRDNGGCPVRMVGCVTDISARKGAEEMLQHVERRQRALITAVSSIVWREDLGAEQQPRNLEWESYTGQTQDEEFGEGWLDAVHPEDRERMLNAWSNAMRQETVYQADIRLRRRDGTYRWMSARGAPVCDASGRVVEYIGLYEDVEDYCSAREELRRKTHELAERVKEMRCLHAIATVCNDDDLAVGEILSGVALVLASAMLHPESATAFVEVEGAVFPSSFQFKPTIRLEAEIRLDGAPPGRIVIGYDGRPGRYAFLPEEEKVLKTAASLVGQMLRRRRDLQRLEQQSQELWRRQAMFEQTEAMAKVGGWEYEIATGKLTWSDEVSRIAGIDPADGSGDERQALASDFLREPLQEALRTGQPFELELPWVLPNGAQRWLHAAGQLQVVDGSPVRIFGIVMDVTEEQEARSRMWHLANHDALTGLSNRRCFGEQLETALSKRNAADALILIDLDHFKDVNDTLGHDVGDALLLAVAERLREGAGDGVAVARLGGDEFAVLASAEEPSTAREKAEAVLAGLRRPLLVAGQMSSLRFSAGLAIAPADGNSAMELLKNADIALYSGKVRGRDAFVPYSPQMRHSMERRVTICSDVRRALEQEEFLPYYQPKVSLKTGEIRGFEALLRWQAPAGLRTPGSFMAAFDDHEIALAIGKRMLGCIIADMQAWRRDGLPFVNVALNTSAAEFTGFDLAGYLLGELSSGGLPAGALGIEVTETVLLGRDADSISPTLQRLQAAGVAIALDDFGTGYASLTHLRQFPVDMIKIDQSFVRGIATDRASQAITSAVLGLGASLGLVVIAEGVETADQAALLRAAGCDEAQGFYFARPMPALEVPRFLQNWPGAELGKLDRSAA